VGNALKYIAWLLKAVIFFVLFAFALNNQAPVNLHFFFGTIWQAPMVLVVLATFVLGLFAGILVMVPIWLNARRQTRTGFTPSPTAPVPGHPDGI
jgi:putative membrane protein